VTYHLNFAPEIKEIISETMRLEHLGFSVPELARNVALQGEKFLLLYDHLRIYHINNNCYTNPFSLVVILFIIHNATKEVDSVCRYNDGLTDLLSRYSSLMDSLSHPQFLLLQDHIRELRRVMYFGSKKLNWNSLGTDT
jgi:dynein heavy chain